MPITAKLDGYELGKWVRAQRTARATLPPENIQRLDSIGFSWDPYADAWEKGFSKLQAFKEREGHCRVSRGYKDEGYSLGQWVSNQRSNRDTLKPEAIQRLEDIGFVWDLLIHFWDEHFNALIKFKGREGHCRVSRGYKDGDLKLGSWVSRQRTESLSLDRRQRLEDLEFTWDVLTEQWDEGFSHLQSFREREGHCRAPRGYIEGNFELGAWVGKQRHNGDHISTERKNRLNSQDFIWDAHVEAWEDGFSKLKQFKNNTGHCKVPAKFILNGFKLGVWVGSQRAKKDKISLDQVQRLNGVGFIWEPHAELWEEGFRVLDAFRKREGHCKVPKEHMEGKASLGTWVGNIRRKKDSLSPERKQRLDDIGFI